MSYKYSVSTATSQKPKNGEETRTKLRLPKPLERIAMRLEENARIARECICAKLQKGPVRREPPAMPHLQECLRPDSEDTDTESKGRSYSSDDSKEKGLFKMQTSLDDL